MWEARGYPHREIHTGGGHRRSQAHVTLSLFSFLSFLGEFAHFRSSAVLSRGASEQKDAGVSSELIRKLLNKSEPDERGCSSSGSQLMEQPIPLP